MDFVNPPKVPRQIVDEALIEKRPVLRLEALAQEQVVQLSVSSQTNHRLGTQGEVCC